MSEKPSDAALEAAHNAHDDAQRDPLDPEAIYTVTTKGLRAALKAAYAVDFPTAPAAAPGAAAPATDAEALAQRFHETYERLAPLFGYETRKDSAKPWADVPDQNKRLMVAVCAEILAAGAPGRAAPTDHSLDLEMLEHLTRKHFPAGSDREDALNAITRLRTLDPPCECGHPAAAHLNSVNDCWRSKCPCRAFVRAGDAPPREGKP